MGLDWSGQQGQQEKLAHTARTKRTSRRCPFNEAEQRRPGPATVRPVHSRTDSLHVGVTYGNGVLCGSTSLPHVDTRQSLQQQHSPLRSVADDLVSSALICASASGATRTPRGVGISERSCARSVSGLSGSRHSMLGECLWHCRRPVHGRTGRRLLSR